MSYIDRFKHQNFRNDAMNAVESDIGLLAVYRREAGAGMFKHRLQLNAYSWLMYRWHKMWFDHWEEKIAQLSRAYEELRRAQDI